MPRTKSGEWFTTTTLARIERRSGKTLYVGLTPAGRKWSVVALESSAGLGPKAVLDDHAHDLIGVFPFTSAVLKAEAYAADWRPSDVLSCTCDQISRTGRKRPQQRRRRR